jgi:hypothetical protein
MEAPSYLGLIRAGTVAATRMPSWRITVLSAVVAALDHAR